MATSNFVQVQPNSSGLKVDTVELTVGANTVERQVAVIGDPTTGGNYAAVSATGQLQVSGGASAATVTGNITASGSGNAISANVANAGNISIQVSGTYVAAFTFQGSSDGGLTWVNYAGARWDNTLIETVTATLTSISMVWDFAAPGITNVRVYASTFTSGTVAVRISQGSLLFEPAPMVSLGASTNLIGAVNLNQINGSTVITAATGIMRVGIAGAGNATLDAAIGTSMPTNTLGVSSAPNAAAGAACSTGLASGLTVLNIKATAGNVYGFSISNTSSATIFLQFYNTAGTPTLGTSVVWWVACPVGVTNVMPGSLALANFATGIGIGASTTATSTGTPSVAPNVTVFYK